MFLSHRSSVRLGSTRLFRPSRSSLLSVSPRLRHSVRASVFIPFNHCVMPFACRASVQASLPKPNQPSVSPPPCRPYPFDRPSDWEKHLKQLAHGRGGTREGEQTLLYFFADSISGSAGGATTEPAREPTTPALPVGSTRESGRGRRRRRRHCPKSHERPFAKAVVEMALENTKREG